MHVACKHLQTKHLRVGCSRYKDWTAVDHPDRYNNPQDDRHSFAFHTSFKHFNLMPLKTSEIEEPTLNLTPMIDIVMLLIIFFMVGTQFTENESEYEIVLPTVSEAQPLTALPDEIVVSIAKDGTLLIGGVPQTPLEVESKLRDAQKNYADQAVVIRGDGQGEYQNVMTILNICKRVKITNVQLANKIETEGGA